MSTPRDRDGFEGRSDGPEGWHEPAHLGGDADATPKPPAEPPAAPGADTWQPAGWDLPAAEPDRPPAAPAPWQPPAAERRLSDAASSGGFPVEQPVMVPPADTWGTQAWALSVGWLLSDGSAPEDAPLAALVRSAPVRPGKEDRAGRVLRGRGNGLDLVAFDIVSPMGRQSVSTHAVTAAPVLGAVPAFRLSPARMWRHGTGAMVPVPSPDPEFDRRWLLLADEDGPQVRRLVEDPVVRQVLLGSDDGDELWSAAGFVAAVRPDGNRPQLIEHHARILAAVVAALAAAV